MVYAVTRLALPSQSSDPSEKTIKFSGFLRPFQYSNNSDFSGGQWPQFTDELKFDQIEAMAAHHGSGHFKNLVKSDLCYARCGRFYLRLRK